MPDNNILEVIREKFDSKDMLKGIDADTDFFDLGVSSLTVVDLQIQVEEALGRQVDTSLLMANPTIGGWVDAYTNA